MWFSGLECPWMLLADNREQYPDEWYSVSLQPCCWDTPWWGRDSERKKCNCYGGNKGNIKKQVYWAYSGLVKQERKIQFSNSWPSLHRHWCGSDLLPLVFWLTLCRYQFVFAWEALHEAGMWVVPVSFSTVPVPTAYSAVYGTVCRRIKVDGSLVNSVQAHWRYKY